MVSHWAMSRCGPAIGILRRDSEISDGNRKLHAIPATGSKALGAALTRVRLFVSHYVIPEMYELMVINERARLDSGEEAGRGKVIES